MAKHKQYAQTGRELYLLCDAVEGPIIHKPTIIGNGPAAANPYA
ncbi:MAG: hypothetical protein V9G20_24190 [Candidatus Promineifilaceae bacterium]